MNGCSLQWSKDQTEVQIKAAIAGSDRILEVSGHIFGRFDFSSTIHRTNFCSKSLLFSERCHAG